MRPHTSARLEFLLATGKITQADFFRQRQGRLKE